MKVCTKCNEMKENYAYDKNRNVCRKCRNKKNTSSYLSKDGNIEKRREYQRYFQKMHRESNPYYKKYLQVLNTLRYKLKKDESLRSHIELLFTSEMNWENYGILWEIDHIISATKMCKLNYSIEEINKLSNIRPLLIKDNRERFKERD